MDYEKKYKDAVSAIKFLLYKSDRENLTADKYREELESIIPELKESEDERMGKEIVNFINHKKAMGSVTPEESKRAGSWIAWLEKQGEQKPIKCNEKWYDFVRWFVKERTDNYTLIPSDTDIHTWCDIILDHAKKELEKQSEEKPADKVEPKFHECEWVVNTVGDTNQVVKVLDDGYTLDDNTFLSNSWATEHYHLWTIQDAKDGDVLSYREGQWCFIYKGIVTGDTFRYYALLSEKGITVNDAAFSLLSSCITPATKEQRDTLEKAMADAGYTFDFKKKELKKIDEEVNGEDYGIDSLYHAQIILEKTLGSVDGYQSDDGILDHKAAITAVKKLYEQQKTAEWSEEDNNTLDFLVDYLLDTIKKMPAEEYAGGLGKAVVLLKSIKDRVQPQPKQEWSEEDMDMLESIIKDSTQRNSLDPMQLCWLDSLTEKHILYSKPKWSKELENRIIEKVFGRGNLESWEYNEAEKIVQYAKEELIKVLRPQNTWKPSEEMLEALYRAVPDNVKEMSEDEMLLDKLYQGLKYGRVLSKK